MANKYKQLQEQFDILSKLNPSDPLLAYREEIKKTKVDLWEESREYDEFIKAFNLLYGLSHGIILNACVYAVKSRIEELKKGGLEKKVVSESALPSTPSQA